MLELPQSIAILIAAGMNLGGLMVGFLLNHFARRREARATQKVTINQTAAQTEQLEKAIKLTELQIQLKAMEATNAAKDAYKEANDVNQKIARLQEQLDRSLATIGKPS